MDFSPLGFAEKEIYEQRVFGSQGHQIEDTGRAEGRAGYLGIAQVSG